MDSLGFFGILWDSLGFFGYSYGCFRILWDSLHTLGEIASICFKSHTFTDLCVRSDKKQIKAIPPNVLWDLDSSEFFGILQASLLFLRSKWWHEFAMTPNIYKYVNDVGLFKVL